MGYRVPAFSYPGGKVKLREWLVRRMPLRGRRYVEPFAGRGNVFWLAVHMLDYREWWLNDPWTCRWFDAIQKVNLRDIPNELTEVLVRMYMKRATAHREDDDTSVAIEGRTMFSGGAKDGISRNWERSPSLIPFKRKILCARSILSSIQPKITDYSWNLCGLEDLSSRDFVYVDPPYYNASTSLYHCNTVNHRDLLVYLQDAPHLWMLSGYGSPLYTRYLGAPTGKRIHVVSCFQQSKSSAPIFHTECIWTNYTIGADGIVKRKRLKACRIRKKKLKK